MKVPSPPFIPQPPPHITLLPHSMAGKEFDLEPLTGSYLNYIFKWESSLQHSSCPLPSSSPLRAPDHSPPPPSQLWRSAAVFVEGHLVLAHSGAPAAPPHYKTGQILHERLSWPRWAPHTLSLPQNCRHSPIMVKLHAAVLAMLSECVRGLKVDWKRIRRRLKRALKRLRKELISSDVKMEWVKKVWVLNMSVNRFRESSV